MKQGQHWEWERLYKILFPYSNLYVHYFQKKYLYIYIYMRYRVQKTKFCSNQKQNMIFWDQNIYVVYYRVIQYIYV